MQKTEGKRPNNDGARQSWAVSGKLHRLSERAAKAIDAQWANPFDNNVLNARPDPIDFRDRYYQPGLIEIKSRHFPKPLAEMGLTVRSQGFEGSCTGQALAAVIDFQNIVRWRDAANVPKRVSARMLYESARLFDEFPDDRLTGSSLRGALKGFFHRGVCDAAKAPYFDGDVGWRLTPDLAKDARRVGLGAYFRLQHELNDYHAAIMETGAILCSAMVHDGWGGAKVKAKNGRIVLPGSKSRSDGMPVLLRGAHAFAIVGYDRDGFLVLNSWGEGWGGFDPEKALRMAKRANHLDGRSSHGRTQPLSGIAHWAYEDWRQHVLDAWALRLTAPTGRPSGFAGGYVSARRGAGGVSSDKPRITTLRKQKICGHYIHVDDGVLVTRPPYDNDEQTLNDTAQFLIDNEAADESERYDHLLFYAHGGLNDLETAAARASAMTGGFKRLGIYPIFYFWRTGFCETLKDVLKGMLPRIETRTEGLGGIADPLIETISRPLGRAVWRDMKLDAARAATPASGNVRIRSGGALLGTRTLMEAAAARQTHPMGVHFIGHSAGAILLGEILNRLKTDAPQLSQLTATIDLFAPACTVEFFKEKLLPYMAIIKKEACTVTNLTADAEALPDASLYPYGKSLLHLVSNAFEEEQHEPIAGMDVFWKELVAPLNPNLDYKSAGAPRSAFEDVITHGAFDNSPAIMNAALSRVLGRRIDERNGGFASTELESSEF